MLLRPLRHQFKINKITIMVNAIRVYVENVIESSPIDDDEPIVPSLMPVISFADGNLSAPALLRQFFPPASNSSGFKFAVKKEKKIKMIKYTKYFKLIF